ncbi:hypothetical protein SOCE26_044460 [Sorangium cellulosum]|uniref:Uncharacterized protein n=1 Tax=Sorangium cellulosum TaxID=56 RepID=A0A2L0EUM6_SORCE|nr:hypothetical protein [Sorangium cellulosum]AUX43006.1 hypothetical protein SOCE26_044460 [Sorangium cellulosum]
MPAQASGTRPSRASTPDRPGSLPGTGSALPGGRASVPGGRASVPGGGASLFGANTSLPRTTLLTTAPPAARWLIAGAAASVAIVVAAALLRDDTSLAALETAVQTENAPPSDSAPRRPVEAPPSDAVPADELATAKARGVIALEALAARYPKDPAIFRALMERHALPPPYHAAALAAAKRLLELDPGAAGDDDVHRVVSGAAAGPPEVASAALELMASGMGSRGPDLLYDLAAGSSALKDRAARRLGEAAVLEQATPALRIAHELRVSPTCKARQALLQRAAKEGDRRAIDVLSPLLVGKSKGCGFFGTSRCPAPCASIAGDIKQTIQAIEVRAVSDPPAPGAAEAPPDR